MATVPFPLSPLPQKIQLPCSSDRRQRGIAFCKLLTSVDPLGHYALGFEGKPYQPGAWVDSAELPERAVVLECAGGVGAWVRGKQRETLWILWKWDRKNSQWSELARAPAISWEWADILRPAAVKALQSEIPGLYDILAKSGEVADQVMELIDTRLRVCHQDLRVNVLSVVIDRITGRLVA